MFHPRNILVLLGVLLVLVGGWWGWRASQPVLTDEEQITANIESLRAAVRRRNTGGVAALLAEDFTWNGQPRRELESLMRGAFLQWRDVQPNITGLEVSVQGNSATASGNYSLAFRPTPKRRAEAYVGEFKLALEKRNGRWLITRAEGGEKLE